MDETLSKCLQFEGLRKLHKMKRLCLAYTGITAITQLLEDIYKL